MLPAFALVLCTTAIGVADPPRWTTTMTAPAPHQDPTDAQLRDWYRAWRDARATWTTPPTSTWRQPEPQALHSEPIELAVELHDSSPPRREHASRPQAPCIDSNAVDVWCFETTHH